MSYKNSTFLDFDDNFLFDWQASVQGVGTAKCIGKNLFSFCNATAGSRLKVFLIFPIHRF